jgi:large subunit ribosomal protein L25
MAKMTTLTAERRSALGTGPTRRLRQAGKVPAVLYGLKEETVHLAVDQASTLKVLQARAQTVELALDGAKQLALIHDADFDLAGERLTHVDFFRVRADEAVEVEVVLKLVGQSKGEKDGGVVDVAAHRIAVRCLPRDIPEQIELKMDAFEIGAVVRAKDLALPAGITLATPPDAAVVSIHHKTVEAAPVAAAPGAEGAAPAEPELIKPERAKEEPEAEGE